MKKCLFTLVGAAVMSTALSTAVLADEDNSDAILNNSYSEMNTDIGDDGISRDEWGSNFDQNGIFNNWDQNGDGFLSPEEHRNGYFTCFDRDKNGRIDREEHHKARRDIKACGLFGG